MKVYCAGDTIRKKIKIVDTQIGICIFIVIASFDFRNSSTHLFVVFSLIKVSGLCTSLRSPHIPTQRISQHHQRSFWALNDHKFPNVCIVNTNNRLYLENKLLLASLVDPFVYWTNINEFTTFGRQLWTWNCSLCSICAPIDVQFATSVWQTKQFTISHNRIFLGKKNGNAIDLSIVHLGIYLSFTSIVRIG